MKNNQKEPKKYINGIFHNLFIFLKLNIKHLTTKIVSLDNELLFLEIKKNKTQDKLKESNKKYKQIVFKNVRSNYIIAS